MKIAVLGGGAWGTALAVAAAARHEVLLWSRDAAQVSETNGARQNARYLPGVKLPHGLCVGANHADALDHGAQGLTVIATPMAGLRSQLQALKDGRPVVWLCKGFETDSGLLAHEVASELGLGRAVGIISGPSFALEVARGQPTALVAASRDAAVLVLAVAAFHTDALRLYTSDDIIGVEVGGAVKNVLAIAAGLLDGLAATGQPSAPGLNARAALVTRGLAEMTRLGVALGARAETFMGLSGLGDLVLTATGDLSRNRRVGLMLAEGLPLQQVLAELGHVAEGVTTAPTVLRRARALGLEMPITEAVADVLSGGCTPQAALQRLMSRDARSESL